MPGPRFARHSPPVGRIWNPEARMGVEITMTAFPIHTIDSAPEGSKETLARVKETLGMIPNLAAGMAESPTLLRAFFAAREIYSQGTLSPVEIEVLSLTIAFENGCEWCIGFHYTGAIRA